MPASPWRTFGASDPNGEYLALLSYLPLKSYWRIPHFFLYTAQVTKQLTSAEGMLGYSVLARPLSKRFWTLSAWKDDAALRTFVQYPPPRAHHECSHSPHERDRFCALDGQRFRAAAELGRCAAQIFQWSSPSVTKSDF